MLYLASVPFEKLGFPIKRAPETNMVFFRVEDTMSFLRDNVGWDTLREKIKAPLRGLKVAPFYGCTLVRPEEVAIDYKRISTLTFGPGGPSDGETVEVVGRDAIEETFEFLFDVGIPPFEEMTMTSGSRIGNQFYQTFSLDNGCLVTDTFLVTGKTIKHQTAFVLCE